MTTDNKDILLRLLQQYKKWGISDQIDYDKVHLDSIVRNSVSLVDCDYDTVIDQSELGKCSIIPNPALKMVDKSALRQKMRYLRQLSEFGYLEPTGSNKNRKYKVIRRESK